MKAVMILFIVLFVATAITALGAAYYVVKQREGLELQISVLKSNEKDLTNKLQEERSSNIELTKQAFPKPFSTSREMVKWIDNNKSLASGSYYSIDAVKLLNRARNDGVWMGLVPVKFNNLGTYYASMTIPTDGGGYVFCVALTADGGLYLIDPSTGTNIKLTEMQAELVWDAVTVKK